MGKTTLLAAFVRQRKYCDVLKAVHLAGNTISVLHRKPTWLCSVDCARQCVRIAYCIVSPSLPQSRALSMSAAAGACLPLFYFTHTPALSKLLRGTSNCVSPFNWSWFVLISWTESVLLVIYFSYWSRYFTLLLCIL